MSEKSNLVITWLIHDERTLVVEKMDGKNQRHWTASIEIDPANQTITFTFDQGYKETYRLIKHGLKHGMSQDFVGVRFFAEVEPL